jgi:hypothetical protein
VANAFVVGAENVSCQGLLPCQSTFNDGNRMKLC